MNMFMFVFMLLFLWGVFVLMLMMGVGRRVKLVRVGMANGVFEALDVRNRNIYPNKLSVIC